MVTSVIQPDASEARAPRQTFIAEVLVSAGPRKSVAEFRDDSTNAELCEDCGGLCWVGDQLLFWLCDGGSNARILPRLPSGEDSEAASIAGFSARILAQDLGRAFVERISRVLTCRETVSEVDLPATVFTPIASTWEERLYRYIAYCDERDIPLIETLPKRYKDNAVARRLDWTSTFTGGVFVPAERRIMLINYGASGGLVIAEPPAIIEPNSDYLGMVAIIQTDEKLHIKLRVSAGEKVRWAEFSDVDGFALVSDGLKRDGNLSERLQELHEIGHNPKDMRSALLKEISPIEDDKAVVFGHFI
jgi:hypothetical protein